MDLILWRHAEAFEAKPDESDLERFLTPRGERQARRMAHWLQTQLPEGTRVLVSPATRCRQTADALARPYKILEEISPDRGVEELLSAVRWPDRKHPVLVVGHQPALGLTAAYLLAGMPQPWSIRKGAVWWLRQRERETGAETILVSVQSPDLLSGPPSK